MKNRFLSSISIALLLQAALVNGALYVRSNAGGTSDGSSWSNAFTNLQDALAFPGSSEIWVAAGTYKPSVTGDTTESFAVRNGQALFGGFAGFETAREQRQPGVHLTILSGDLNGDGVTGPGDSAHVVHANGPNVSTVLDGFTITRGYAVQATYPGSSGAGLLIEGGSITLRNCIFRDHIAQLGAGLLSYDSTLTIEDCRFENNLASQGRGGGIYAAGDSGDAVLHPLTLRRCAFLTNTATGASADGYGGALYADFDVPVDASECSFIGNESRWRFAYGQYAASGGAALLFADGSRFDRCVFRQNRSHMGGALWLAGDTTLVNCLFVGNEAFRVSSGAYDYGGYAGAVYAVTAHVIISGCTLHANHARSTGGVWVGSGSSSSVTIVNSILWSNTATEEDAKPLDPQIGGDGTTTIRYSCVRDLLTPIPGEDPPDPTKFPGCIVVDPKFISERGLDNIAGNADDDLHLRNDSPCLDAGSNGDLYSWAMSDVAGEFRRHDVAATPDTGSGLAPVTDMGAYEVAPPLIPALARIAPGQMQLDWTALGAGWRYTVEWTPDLGTPSWQPFPPTNQWPTLLTNTAFDASTLGTAGFFRIRPSLMNP